MSNLESLPTELWWEIFEFFDATEIFYTFGNLNSTVTSMLFESSLLYLKISTIKHYDFTCNVILPSVKSRANVKSIKFYQEFQIEEFFTLWPMNTFSHLRCLSLTYMGALMSDCSNLLLEQLSALPHFESLNIQVGRITQYDKCLTRLIQLIFVENHAFHALKCFTFQSSHHGDFLALPVTQKQTKLEVIAFPSLYFHELLRLFPCMPRIKSITINSLLIDFDNIKPLSGSFLPSLVYLNLRLGRNLTCEDLEGLLCQTSNLNQLTLACPYCRMNGHKWETLLTDNCIQLRKLELIFSPLYFDTLPEIIELRNTFSTPFWLERNVQFEHDEKIRHFIVRFKI